MVSAGEGDLLKWRVVLRLEGVNLRTALLDEDAAVDDELAVGDVRRVGGRLG